MTDERTVQVRVAVAVDAEGAWCATGWNQVEVDESEWEGLEGDAGAEPFARFWLTATLPIPRPSEPVEVAADVEEVPE